jgi:FecR protein
MHTVVRRMPALLLALAALFASPATFALDTGDIIVKAIKGEVHVTMNGAERAVRAGVVLELPATIRTGRDGAVDLAQGATTVSVGPETLLEFPALETRGGPIDKIVQPRGNAFYSIGKREGRRLRVETPYLVAVIKGTQFNVAAQDQSTTVSLFEGLLEVRAIDDSDVVNIKAGEIAARKLGDKVISVIKMDSGKASPTQRAPAGASGTGVISSSPAAAPAANVDEDSLLADREVALNAVTGVTDNARVSAGASGLNLNARAELGGGVAAANTAISSVNLSSSATDPGAAGSVNAPGAAGGAGTAINIGAATDVGVNAAVNSGNALATGANAGVSAGAAAVDIGASTHVDAAPATTIVAATTNTNVDLGSSTVATNAGVIAAVGAGSVAANVDLGANANASSATVAAGASTVANLGANTSNVAVNVAAGANVAGVTAGVNTNVDVSAGHVDLGVNVTGVVPGPGVNLGLDDGNNGHGNDANHSDPSNPGNSTPGQSGPGNSSTPAPTTPVVDVADLVDGLLKKHRKK